MALRSLRFGSFTLDLERLSLSGPSGFVELRPKSFDVLSYLLHHAGRVVDKEEMIKAVWPGVTVTEESLTQCISEVRRALGDESRRIIKTVPKRGYLFDMLISAPDIPLRGPAVTALDSPDRVPPAVQSVVEDIAVVERKVATLCAYLNESFERIAERHPREAVKVFEAVVPLVLQTIQQLSLIHATDRTD